MDTMTLGVEESGAAPAPNLLGELRALLLDLQRVSELSYDATTLAVDDAGAAVVKRLEAAFAYAGLRPAEALGRPAGSCAAERDPGAPPDRLVEGHGAHIAAIARRYCAPGVEMSDLMQEGWLALLEARARFDPSRGVPFWAYAASWVHGAIHRHAYNERRAVRLPAAAQAELGQLRRAAQGLGGTPAGEPAVAEAAEACGVRPERAEALIVAGRPARSFQEPLGSEADGSALLDTVPDPRAEDPYEEVLARADPPDVKALLCELSDREQDVIAARFGLSGEPQTLSDIGRRMGVTRERVRQIEARALGKLKVAAGDDSGGRPRRHRSGRAGARTAP